MDLQNLLDGIDHLERAPTATVGKRSPYDFLPLNVAPKDDNITIANPY